MYSLLQCGQAKSQIEAVSISTDKGGEIFLSFSKFLGSSYFFKTFTQLSL